MHEFEHFKKKLMTNAEVAKEYEVHHAKFDIARALIKARISAKLTPAEVLRKCQFH